MPLLNLHILLLNAKYQLLIIIHLQQLRLIKYLYRRKWQLLFYFPSELADKWMVQDLSSGRSFLGIHLKDPFKQVDDVLVVGVQ